MKNFLLTSKLSLHFLVVFATGSTVTQAGIYDGTPCDTKIIAECGVEYTATLEPNSGSWTNYTGVAYNYTGSEQVFEFTAQQSGLFTIELNQGTGDADFMIMNACSNAAGNIINFYWTGEHEEYINLVAGVTYYIIADLYQSSLATTVSIKINCPDGVVITIPDYPCFQGDGITSSFDDGLNLDPINVLTKVADDFIVQPGTQFTIYQITIDTNQIQSPDNAIFNIRENNNGVPGSIIKTIELAPSSSVPYAAAYNEPVYHMTFDLAEPMTFGEGTYWLEPKMTTPQPSTVWWLITTTGSNGANPVVSEDGGQSWLPMYGYQAVFFVAGECESLGTNDLSPFNFNYYPNPVYDQLIIESQKNLKLAEVFSLTGQKIHTTSEIKNGIINLSLLKTGVYIIKITLENNQIETFKIIKK